jgi:hypothetical protein
MTLTNLTFTLDGNYVGNFTFPRDQGATEYPYNYNVSVYVNTTLTNSEHTLVLEHGNHSIVLFDYIIYT